MIRKIHILLIIVFIGLQWSCTTNKNLVYLENLPKTTEKTHAKKNTLETTLQVGDIVYVRILSINKEINDLFNIDNSSSQNISSETSIALKGFTIDQNGYIRLPIIDTINIKGLNIFDAERKIQLKVNEYFKNATVILKPLNTKISILGEVNRPGSFQIYRNDVNIFDAIAMAGDVNQYANKKTILIIRTIGDENVSFRIDLTDKNIIESKDFYLLPNDIVIVEPLKLKSFRINTPTFSLFFQGLTATITTLSFFLIQLNL